MLTRSQRAPVISCCQWHNRQGGRVPPPDAFHQEIFADPLGKERQEKREIGKLEKKIRKIVKRKGKLKIFFFFCLSLLETTKFCFWCNKMQISTGKKSGKVNLPPSPKKYSSYAPACCSKDDRRKVSKTNPSILMIWKLLHFSLNFHRLYTYHQRFYSYFAQ